MLLIDFAEFATPFSCHNSLLQLITTGASMLRRTFKLLLLEVAGTIKVSTSKYGILERVEGRVGQVL